MSAGFRVLSAAHHRNGVAGDPFWVGIVEAQADTHHTGEDTRFQIVVVPEVDDEGEVDDSKFWPKIYVTDLNRSANESSVRFGYNSWRGDMFQDEAAAIVKEAQW